jgi:hypothetical protein
MSRPVLMLEEPYNRNAEFAQQRKINLVEIKDLKFMTVLVAYFYLNVENVYKFVGFHEHVCVL